MPGDFPEGPVPKRPVHTRAHTLKAHTRPHLSLRAPALGSLLILPLPVIWTESSLGYCFQNSFFLPRPAFF